jgi:zinc/manganese transport system substrate-binding protein
VRSGIAAVVIVVALAAGPCGGTGATGEPAGPSVVVTTSVLGAVVQDLVGDRAEVTVLMGNGVDPHDWAPSAKDIEKVMNADLVVANGLGLEEGLEKTLDEAEKAGVAVFHGGDHIQVRPGGGHEHGGEATPGAEASAKPEGDEHEHEGGDPHFWVDPMSMGAVVTALTAQMAEMGVDVQDRGADLEQRLKALDEETRTTLAVVPETNRQLVTGHVSLGYFADRYDFELIGSVIPGLSSNGEVSAGELAQLKADIEEHGVKAIFTELGTSDAVVAAISEETGVQVVRLALPVLPDDGSYFTYIRGIATDVADALR